MERPRFLSASANELHQVAKDFHPSVPGIKEHFVKESHVLVAVERYDWEDERWATEESRDRFLWIKGRMVYYRHESHLLRL